VIAARQALLRQLRSVNTPAQMRSLVKLLDQAFQQSITADGYYRAGFLAIGNPESGCSLPRNASFKLAAKADALATKLKQQFLARFNPLAGRYQRPTWKAAKIERPRRALFTALAISTRRLRRSTRSA
jgi:hypothetical protein